MRPALRAWLEERYRGAETLAMAGDASTRQFFRLVPVSGPSRVVMDYGAPFREPSDDQRMTAVFQSAGLPVPGIVDAGPSVGCLVLEDLGLWMLEDELRIRKDQGEPPQHLLDAAELAGRVARDGSVALAASELTEGPALDEARFRFEMDFFVENFIVLHRKINVGEGKLRGLLYALARDAAQTPRRVLCHRDFHSRNLMITADGGLALVDLQDARWGPDTYDVVSLAFDAYVDRPDSWVDPLVRRYLQEAAIVDDTPVRHRVHLTAAQRMIKALGTFGYQVEVRKNPRFADAIPRTLGRLAEWLPRSEATRGIHEAFVDLGLVP